MPMNYYLGISSTTWQEIKDIMDDRFNGDIDRFLTFYNDSWNRIDSQSVEIVKLRAEIADMKLPLLKPLFTTVVKCVSFDATGYRCKGGDYEAVDKRDYCMQCKCYDPE